MEAAAAAASLDNVNGEESNTNTANKTTATVKNNLVEKEVPLKDDIASSSPKKKVTSTATTSYSNESLDESLSDSAFSGTSTSSLLSRQLESGTTHTINVRLGGCADPTVVVGSITDHHYIDRKASVVGNARLEAYGGRGGGFFTSYERGNRAVEEEEDESTLLDELDQQQDHYGSNTNSFSTLKDGRRRPWVLKWEVGASSECGVRNSNEDSYVVINNLDEVIESEGLNSFSHQDLGKTSQQGLYAIFDGHVGNQAARYSAEVSCCVVRISVLTFICKMLQLLHCVNSAIKRRCSHITN